MKIEITPVASAAEEVAPQPERVRTSVPKLSLLGGASLGPAAATPSQPSPKIPAILLEGDDPPLPPFVTGPGEKFLVAPAPPVAPLAPEPRELPAAYGTLALWLAARAPRCLYAHWDRTDDQQHASNSRAADRGLVLRIGQGSAGGTPVFEVHVEPEARHRFIDVPLAGACYGAELGYYEPGGRWTMVATSDVVTTPPEAAAEDTTVRFATMALEPVAPSSPSPAAVQSLDPVVRALEPLLGLPCSPAQPLGGTSAPAPLAEIVPTAPPMPGERRAALEPSLLSPPLDPGVLASPDCVATLPAGAGSGGQSSARREEASFHVRREWTPARERALAEFTRSWTSRGGGDSAQLLDLARQRSLGAPWAAPSAPAREKDAIQALQEERVEAPGVSSPRGGVKPAPAPFWLNLNAELVIYGATEPGARLVFAGQPLEPRNDGTFSFRLALPDGEFEVVLSAASGRTDDRREATLRLSRRTECRGEVGESLRDRSLPQPPVAR